MLVSDNNRRNTRTQSPNLLITLLIDNLWVIVNGKIAGKCCSKTTTFEITYARKRIYLLKKELDNMFNTFVDQATQSFGPIPCDDS